MKSISYSCTNAHFTKKTSTINWDLELKPTVAFAAIPSVIDEVNKLWTKKD